MIEVRGKEPFLTSENRAAIDVIMTRHAGARPLESSGPSVIFEARRFVEVDAAAAPAMARDIELAGLLVSTVEESLSAFAGAAAVSVGTPEELKAAADALMDGSRAARAAAFGGLVGGIEAAAPASLPEDVRNAATLALHGALVPYIDAYNNVRGDQESAARQAWIDTHGRPANPAQYQEMVRASRAELDRPERVALVVPYKEIAARAGEAIERLASPLSVPLLMDLAPLADYAYLQRLTAHPERTGALLRSWIGYLRDSVSETARLIEADPNGRVSRRSGGYGVVDASYNVLGAFDWETRRINPAELRHERSWMLIGALPTGPLGPEIARLFSNFIVEAEPLVARLKAAWKVKIEREAVARAERYAEMYGKDEKSKAEIRQSVIEQEAESYERHDRVTGEASLQAAVGAIPWALGPYDDFMPGYSANRFVSLVAWTLADAAARVSDRDSFALLADTALQFVSETRRWKKDALTDYALDLVSRLEAQIKARAARDGVQVVDEKN